MDPSYDRDLVRDHRRVFCILLRAIFNAPFEPRIHRCSSAPEAWQMITGCTIPQTADERYLLEQQLEHVRLTGEEHLDAFLARVDGLLNTLSHAGVRKSDKDVGRILVRQLP
ncbi:unnamed protein product, partial [Hapterophycus canaliculatus]